MHRYPHAADALLHECRLGVRRTRTLLMIHVAVDITQIDFLALGEGAVRLGLGQTVIAEHRALVHHRTGDTHIVAHGLGIIDTVGSIRVHVAIIGQILERILLVGHFVDGDRILRGHHQARFVLGRGGIIGDALHPHRVIAIGPDHLRGHRIGRVLRREGIAQLVAVNALAVLGLGIDVGQHPVALVAVVVALGGVGDRSAALGYHPAADIIENAILAAGIVERPAVLAGFGIHVPLRHLALAVDRLLVLVQQLHLDAVHAGIFHLAVIVQVDKAALGGHGGAVGVLEVAQPIALGVEGLVGGQEEAAVVAAMVGRIATQIVRGRSRHLGIGVVLQLVPIRIDPDVVANIAARGRSVDVGAGLLVLEHLGRRVANRAGTDVNTLNEAVPLGHLGQALGQPRIGLGVHIEVGHAVGAAQVLGQVQRGMHLVVQLEEAGRGQEQGLLRDLRPHGTHGLAQLLLLLGMTLAVGLDLLQLHEMRLPQLLLGIFADKRIALVEVDAPVVLTAQAPNLRQGILLERHHDIGRSIEVEGTEPHLVLVGRQLMGADTIRAHRRVHRHLQRVEVFQPAVPRGQARNAVRAGVVENHGVVGVGHDVEEHRMHVAGRQRGRAAAVDSAHRVGVIAALGHSRRAVHLLRVVRRARGRRALRLVVGLNRGEAHGRQLHLDQHLGVDVVEVPVARIVDVIGGGGVLVVGDIGVVVAVLVGIAARLQVVEAQRGVGIGLHGNHDLHHNGLARRERRSAHRTVVLGFSGEVPAQILALHGTYHVAALVGRQQAARALRVRGRAHLGIGQRQRMDTRRIARIQVVDVVLARGHRHGHGRAVR